MTSVSESVSTLSARVDGAEIAVPAGSTVLAACRQAGADIPTLCYGPTMTAANACRVGVVEIEGSRTLVPSCSRKLEDGMEITTDWQTGPDTAVAW